MSIAVSSLNALLNSLNLSNQSSQSSADRSDSVASEALSLFTAGLAEEVTTQTEGLILDTTKFSDSGTLLTQLKNSISKMAVGVLDASNLVQSGSEGLKKMYDALKPLLTLFQDAQDQSLSTDERAELQEKMQAILSDFSKIVDETKYGDQKIFTADGSAFIPTSQTMDEVGVTIVVVNLTADKLNLDQLDASTSDNAKKSFDIVSKILEKIKRISSQFEDNFSKLQTVADGFIQSLQSIVSAQNKIGNDPVSLALSFAGGDLLTAQNAPSVSDTINLLS